MSTSKKINRNYLQGILLAAAILLVIALAYQFYQIQTATTWLYESNERQLLSYRLANELRQTSDDLTRMARTYAVTGNPLYLKQYQAVLDIRNGVIARPEQYYRAYWDFVIKEGMKPRPDSTVKRSLNQLMKDAGFTDSEFALLAETERRSNDLVKLETRAVMAVEGKFEDGQGGYTQGEPDLALARNLLHGPDYHAIKAKIMEPLDQFYVQMEERTAGEVKQAEIAFNRAQTLFTIFLVTTVIVIALLVYSGKRQTAIILGARPDELESVLSEVAKGNLSMHLRDSRNGSVYKLIASTVETLRLLIGKMRSEAHNMNEGIVRLHDKAQIVREDSDEMKSIVEGNTATIEEITTSVDHIACNAERVQEIVEKTNRDSMQSVQSVDEVADRVKTMADLAQSVGKTMETLSERSNQIISIVDVIRDIADQTNLLALNAAIEAARAGEYGRGFAVVADEVRKLAERSSLATVDIAEQIDNIRQETGMALDNVMATVSYATDCVDSTETAVTRIGEIQNQMASAVKETEHIANATREQSIAITEIAKSMEILNQKTESTNDQIVETVEVSDYLDGSAQELQKAVAQFSV